MAKTEYTGQLVGGPGDGNLVTATVPKFLYRIKEFMWIDGEQNDSTFSVVNGYYVWNDKDGVFVWQLRRPRTNG